MVDYILGNYLVEAGKISKEQLADVLQEQNSVRVKLGLIAVAEGMMTQEEADEVNHLQSVMDKRYGDIAVEKGYLTDDQVSMLLKKQGNVYLMFVQTLVDKQLVTMDEWECILSDFKRKNGLGNTELEDLKSDEPERIIPLLLPAEAASYQGIIGTMVRTMIRLIDRHIYVGHAVMLDDFPAEDLVKQCLVGTDGIMGCLSERDGGLLHVCSVFGREEFEKLDMDALDAAGELLNCVNGLYASNMSREGKQLELTPPEYTAGADNVKKESICRIPIFVGNKGLYFVIGELA